MPSIALHNQFIVIALNFLQQIHDDNAMSYDINFFDKYFLEKNTKIIIYISI